MIPRMPSVETVLQLMADGHSTVPGICRYLHPELPDYEMCWFRSKVYHRMTVLERYRMIRRAGYTWSNGSRTVIWELCE